jgi:hypothetical protein
MYKAVLIVVASLVSAGCTKSASSLSTITLGMTKDEVLDCIGSPDVVRGAIRNKFGQVVEVHEYTLAMPSKDGAGEVIGKSFLTVFTFGIGAASFKSEKRLFWLYFHDDKLVQWGQAGDWSREADRIYEYRFR